MEMDDAQALLSTYYRIGFERGSAGVTRAAATASIMAQRVCDEGCESAVVRRDGWLDGYQWALSHLDDEGVQADAARLRQSS